MTADALPFRPYPEAKPLAPVPEDEDPLARAEPAVAVLYEHRKRPEWGLAIRVRERDGRADYQFEDGQLRPIAPDFDHLMVVVDRPLFETAATLRQLQALSGEAMARSEREQESGPRAISFDEQVEWFVEHFPEGFDDPSWSSKVRGVGQARRIKAHREPAIAEAQKLLAAAEIDELLAQMRGDEIVARAVRIMRGTSLVSKAQVAPFEELDPQQHGLVGRAIRDLLYGQDEIVLRFAKLMQAFRHTPTSLCWPAATVLLALVHPTEHVCVRPTTIAEQARWIAPSLQIPNVPDGRTYLRVLDIVRAARNELEKRGFVARDLMDVYDFIWTTLRPAACKAIRNRPPAPRSSQVRMAEGA